MKTNDKFTFGKFKGMTLKYVMENKGSYVGWCMENIPNFHIEPKSLEDEFMNGYNIWKKDHKGLTISNSHPIPIGVKSAMNHLKNMLDERHCDDIDFDEMD